MTVPREDKMPIALQAREEARSAVEELERLKRELRAAYLSHDGASEHEFDRKWPEICSDTLRLRALSRTISYDLPIRSAVQWSEKK